MRSTSSMESDVPRLSARALPRLRCFFAILLYYIFYTELNSLSSLITALDEDKALLSISSTCLKSTATGYYTVTSCMSSLITYRFGLLSSVAAVVVAYIEGLCWPRLLIFYLSMSRGGRSCSICTLPFGTFMTLDGSVLIDFIWLRPCEPPLKTPF